MKKSWIRMLGLALCLVLALPALSYSEEAEEEITVTVIPEEGAQAELGVADVGMLLEADGLTFKDLNKNGALDPYEDWRLPSSDRADDLLSQMTDTDKAAQMLHMTMVTLKESWFNELNVGFVLAYTYLADGVEAAVTRTNRAQALCEESRMGIPVVFSMDSVIGASWIDETTVIPDQITLAAAGNVALVREIAEMQRLEMKALGIRMSLSPVADIATDPRWGRAQECFGEDAEVAARMVVAMVDGLQNGNHLTRESVMACVKHFPGSGPQSAGVDGTPLVYDNESFQMHLSVFKAAIDAGAASVMPYGYSTVPFLGGDAVDNYAHESSTVMTTLLRGELGFEGIIQTDWGLNHTAAALAGADALGGAGQRESKKLVENLTTEQLDERVRRLLIAKLDMGLFEDPYSDLEKAKEVVGAQAHYDLVKRAAAEALTLVKYENITPLAGQRLIVAGALAENVAAHNSGWKIEEHCGQSILEAVIKKAGANNVTYIGDDASLIAAGDPKTTTAIVVVGEQSGTHEPAWGTATLEFPAEQQEMVAALRNAGVRVVSVVLMNRAYVLTPIVENSDAVLLCYRPGMTAGAEAVVDALFGDAPIFGKTPFQIPASMNQVLLQREDLPKDIVDPLYAYGFGIEIAAFGK